MLPICFLMAVLSAFEGHFVLTQAVHTFSFSQSSCTSCPPRCSSSRRCPSRSPGEPLHPSCPSRLPAFSFRCFSWGAAAFLALRGHRALTDVSEPPFAAASQHTFASVDLDLAHSDSNSPFNRPLQAAHFHDGGARGGRSQVLCAHEPRGVRAYSRFRFGCSDSASGFTRASAAPRKSCLDLAVARLAPLLPPASNVLALQPTPPLFPDSTRRVSFLASAASSCSFCWCRWCTSACWPCPASATTSSTWVRTKLRLLDCCFCCDGHPKHTRPPLAVC